MPVETRRAGRAACARPRSSRGGRSALRLASSPPPPRRRRAPRSSCARRLATNTCRRLPQSGECSPSGSPASASTCSASTTTAPAIPRRSRGPAAAGRVAREHPARSRRGAAVWPSGSIALVGLRAGAMLALQAAARMGGVDRLVAVEPLRYRPRLRARAQGDGPAQRAGRGGRRSWSSTPKVTS